MQLTLLEGISFKSVNAHPEPKSGGLTLTPKNDMTSVDPLDFMFRR